MSLFYLLFLVFLSDIIFIYLFYLLFLLFKFHIRKINYSCKKNHKIEDKHSFKLNFSTPNSKNNKNEKINNFVFETIFLYYTNLCINEFLISKGLRFFKYNEKRISNSFEIDNCIKKSNIKTDLWVYNISKEMSLSVPFVNNKMVEYVESYPIIQFYKVNIIKKKINQKIKMNISSLDYILNDLSNSNKYNIIDDCLLRMRKKEFEIKFYCKKIRFL